MFHVMNSFIATKGPHEKEKREKNKSDKVKKL